jgi:hypothetical protein
MRDIKFRAWGPKSKVMLDWPDIIDDFKYYVDHPSYRLMQYTGLKDKNGVEIYEGDILKAPYFQTAAVEYMESGFWCKQGKHNMLPNLTDAEVIGNIYENPELLKS